MKKWNGRVALAIAIATMAASAQAQTPAADAKAQADTLGQCLVLKTTGADRIALAKWAVSALASIPRLKDVATVDPAKREAADRGMANLVTRLILVDCASEASPLFKAGGRAGLQIAFEVLGKIAMQEVTRDPDAEAALGSFGNYIDKKAFSDLAK